MNKLQTTKLPLNLQLFAEEEEENKPTENEEGSNTENSEDKEDKKQTFDDLLADRDYQSAFDARITKALQTAKEKWLQEQKEEQSEADKLKKMTAEEKAKYQIEQDKAELEKAKAEFQRAKLETSVGNELLSRGFNAEFAKFLTGIDAEQSKSNIDAFEKAFNSAVEAKTKDTLRGDDVPNSSKEPNSDGKPPENFHEYEKWREKNN